MDWLVISVFHTDFTGQLAFVRRIEQLSGEPFGHRLLVAATGSRDEPADAERLHVRDMVERLPDPDAVGG